MSCCDGGLLNKILWFLVLIPTILYGLKWLYKKSKEAKLQRMLNRWNDTPKDVVILHTFPPGKTIPSPSNYVLKVETYLRMAGFKYEYDFKDTFGPKGKAPWISVNSEHVGDSQLIVEFLSKKFEKNFSHNVEKEALAISTMSRVLLEEHFIWGLAMERFVFGGRHYIDKTVAMPSLLKMYLGFIINWRSQSQGIGVHSESEIVQFLKKDLIALSTLLGNKKFICGDSPTEDDCGIFGMLAQIVWALPNSPYETLIKGELKNLEEYCERMKERFWKDWDQVIRP